MRTTKNHTRTTMKVLGAKKRIRGLRPSSVAEGWHRLTVSAMKRAYAPYSSFFVGATLVAKSGVAFSGCNVENVCAGAGICAERTALSKAVSEGCHAFVALYLVTATDIPVSPCGICLQMLSEFCGPEMPVVVGNAKKILFTKKFKDFLPYPYLRKDRVRA